MYHVPWPAKTMSRNQRHPSRIRPSALYVLVFAVSFVVIAASGVAQVAPFAFPGAKPADIPQAWRPLIGEYAPEHPSLIVLEKSAHFLLPQIDATETIFPSPPNSPF